MRTSVWTLGALAALVIAPAVASADANTCREILDKLHLEATPEAQARFANLRGSCEDVVERDGRLYLTTTAVVRRATVGTVTLYVPATDHTFQVSPSSDARVTLAGRQVRPRDLIRGQEISIYIPVDSVTRPVMDEVAVISELPTEEIEVLPAEPVAVLPTTG